MEPYGCTISRMLAILLIVTTQNIHETHGIIVTQNGFCFENYGTTEVGCKDDPYTGPKPFRYFKDGKEILQTAGKYDYGNNSETLSIFKIGDGDGGEYKCTDVKTGDSGTFVVNVATGGENGKAIVKNQGDTFYVECNCWGYQTPTVTKWSKDGKQIVADDHYSFESKPTAQAGVSIANGRLKIKNGQTSDTGTYQCLAENNLEKRNFYTKVLVRNPLVFVGPALGILALLILLAVGIGVLCYFINRQKKQDRKRKSRWARVLGGLPRPS